MNGIGQFLQRGSKSVSRLSKNNQRRQRRSRIGSLIYVGFLLAIGLIWLGSIEITAAQSGPHDQEAQARIEAAWTKGIEASRYGFRSQLTQEVYPVPSVANAGRPPEVSHLAIDGSFLQAEQRMETTIWTDLTFDPNRGAEMLIEDGRSYVRNSAGEWEQIDDLSQSFAPGGDPFSFLAGLSQVEAAGQETRTMAGVDVVFDRYTFELNSGAFASYVERETARIAAADTDLPSGMEPGPNERLRGMTGVGQVWLNAEGFIARIEMDLETTLEDGEIVQATLVNDFSGYESGAQVETTGNTYLTAPLQRIGTQIQAAAHPENALNVGWTLLGIVLLVLLALFVWHHFHTKEFYTTIASLIIVGMVFPPLLQAREARAYYQNEIVRSETRQTQEAEYEAHVEAEEALAQNNWNPQGNPLAAGDMRQAAVAMIDDQTDLSATRLLATTNTDTDEELDSDADGVSDDLEIFWGSCPYLSGSSEYSNSDACASVTDVSDSDGDGLSDATEILQLGTLPYTVDTDGDTITDTVEAAGFTYMGQEWFLNPLEADSNNDGLNDGLECFIWSSENSSGDTSQICPDTDGDGEPDLFDIDNDGDGLLDEDDDNPSAAGGVYDADSPLELTIDGLETDHPVLVQLQLRPTDPELLTLNGHVLDWPTGDYDGQLMRDLDTTFATTTNADAYSDGANAAYGDMRIIPILQVTMPYEDGHYANLPVNDSYSGIDRTSTLTVGQWIDMTELDAYGISVSDADASGGDLIAYVPLTTQYSEDQSTAVAFNATMVYDPSQGTAGIADWGEAHHYELLWMVMMLTDSCIDPEADDVTTCDREESYGLVHTYRDDSWQLTGMNVSEQHGLKMAQMYEDPSSPSKTAIDSQLSVYAWNIGNTFVQGIDCDSTVDNGDGTYSCVGDGNRDVEIADIEDKLDEWGVNTDTNANENYVEFDGVYSYPHEGYWGAFTMIETNDLLDTAFDSYTDQEYVSILYAAEADSRSQGLAEIATAGSDGLTFDLADLPNEVVASMVWKVYQYDDSDAKWGEADVGDYIEYVTDYLAANDSFFIPADDSTAAAEDAEGKLIWVQSYITSLLLGQNALVSIDDNAFEVPDFYDEEDFNSFLSGYEIYASLAFTTGYSRLGTFVFYQLTYWGLGASASITAGQYIRLMYSVETAMDRAYNLGKGLDSAFRSGTIFKIKSFTLRVRSFSKLLNSWRGLIGISTALLVVGGILIITGILLSEFVSQEAGYWFTAVGLILMLIGSVILVTLQSVALLANSRGIAAVIAAVDTTSDFGAKVATRMGSLAKTMKKTARGMAVFAFFVGVGIALTMFALTMSSLGGNPREFQVINAVVLLAVTLIVELVLFILSLIFPVGTIIVGLISLYDLIAQVVNFFVNNKKDEWPTVEWVTKKLADAIYDFDLYIANMTNDPYRIGTNFEIELTDKSLGYIRGNSLIVTTSVTNTLWTKTNRDDLRTSSFTYTTSFDPDALADVELTKGANEDDWVTIDYSEFKEIHPEFDEKEKFDNAKGAYLVETPSIEIPFDMMATGINATVPRFYLSESYLFYGEGCWQALGIDTNDCKEYDFDGYWSTEVSGFAFDVWPSTMSEFAKLRWELTTLKMPEQYDQDRDGLINRYFNGADPDDTTADSDGDGIGDYYEVVNGLDALTADGDEDGLNDWEEVFQYNTDPTVADTDNDGLSDYMEVKQGWLIGYTDENGVAQTTRVWSEPLFDDADGDGLGDLQEYLYGLHPGIPNDSSVIDNLIQIESIDLEEEGSPVILLKMEDESDDTVITDHSGYGNSFSCENCPTADVDGYYGQALEFDGSNDQLTAIFDIELVEFTTAAWIYPDAGGNSGWNTIMGGGDATPAAERAPTMFLINESDVQVSFGDGSTNYAINVSSVVTPDSWNHVAATFDGTLFTLYVNGTAVGTNTSAAGIDPADISDYYIGYRGTNRRFDGKIDELIVYDSALAETEIDALMDGRYNTNDLIVLPETDLTYQAVITNNAASRNASGFIYADTTIETPEIPTPLFAAGFEVEQRQANFRSEIELKNWATSNTALAYCEDDGTCPTINSDGVYGNAIDFDGVDDALVIPQFTDGGSDYEYGPHLFFWLYIDSLPESGRVKILDTDSTDSAALDIELSSNGRIHFDSNGHEDLRGTLPLEVDTWYQIGLLGGEVYIQGGVNSITNFGDETNDSSTHYQPIIGPGRLGDAVGGGEAFDGRIDDLVLYYDTDMSYLEASAFLSQINDGDYSRNGISPDEIFTFEGLFSDVDDLTGVTSTSEVFYAPSTTRQFVDTVADNGGVLTCTDDGTCPTAGVSGPYGNAIDFDGGDDFLIVPKLSSEEVVEQASDETHIFFWLNIDSYPTSGNKAMILDSDSIEDGSIDIYLDSSGYLHFDSLAYEDGVSASPIGTGSWVHIGYRRGDELFINGVSQGNITPTSADYNYPVYGPGRLGNSMAGDAPFDGQIDELTIFHEGGVTSSIISDYIYQGDYFRSASGLRADAVFAFDELIDDDVASDVGYINLANGLRDADCVDSEIGCPTVTTGVYGDGLTFDGTNDALELTDLDFAQSDYTIGVWFKSTDSNNQSFLSATDENGLAVHAHLNTGGLPRILHRLPGGTSGGFTVSASNTYNDGEWHYFTAVKDDTTLTLYVDGVWQGEATDVTTAATGPLETAVGYRSVGSLYHLNGSLDELVVLDEAVDSAGVQYLMNSQYPAIDIENRFTPFELSPLTTTTVSGTAQVAENVDSGATLGFLEEVEAAFELEVDITETTFLHDTQDDVDDGSDLSGYFRFEEIPGASSFNNQVVYTENVDDDTVEVNGLCDYTNCPLSGVRGVDGRALYFDGLDDFLWLDMTVVTSPYRPQAQSVSVWVKGTEGTIFNRALSANDNQLQLDHGRISYISFSDDYVSADFDMPVNEWTHVVVSIADDGRIRTWVDGVLVVDLHTYDESAADDVGNWVIGANYGTQNHYQGYIDELYIYENELTEAEMVALYTETAPAVRFEFDEESDEVNFVDAVNGYVAKSVSTECVDLSLETLTVQQLDDTLSNLALHVAGETVAYLSVDGFGAVVTDTTAVSTTLNVNTPICATSLVTATGVYSDGTEIVFSGSVSQAVVETAATDLVFSSGLQQMTLSYSTGAIYGINTPIAGTDGRIGNNLYFPGYGDGYLDILNSEGLGDFSTDDFTIMTWVKTDVGDNPLFTKSNADGLNDDGEKILKINSAGELEMASRGGSHTKIRSTDLITDNIWHHVVVTWDYDGSGINGTGAIYVDGVDVTDLSSDYDASYPDNSSDGWQIGRRDRNDGIFSAFDGQLDEFAVYIGRAMSSAVVNETYLREARWYRDRGVFSVIVDTDAPTMTIQTDNKYVANGYNTVVITPEDPTSAVELIQYGVKGPNDAAYNWDTAELCADSFNVYCPTFYADGEGTYELVYRLVDSVGNETISDVDAYYVDETPIIIVISGVDGADPVRVASVPNFDTRLTAEAVTNVSVVISQTSETGWLASFGGTYYDPEIDTGVPGSGIDEDAFYVTIYNEIGDIIGVANQPATVDEGAQTWQIDYAMTTYAPAGQYSIEIHVQDELGNETEGVIGTFTIDAQAPFVNVARDVLGDQTISTTHVVTGVVSDQASYTVPSLQLPFEEDATATAFYHYGIDPAVLACSGNCPTTTANGAFGRGLDFDGTTGWSLDSAVISDAVDFTAIETFSIAFWMQADNPQTSLTPPYNVLVEKWGDGSAYPYSIRYHNQAGSNQGIITAQRFDGTETTVVSSTTTLSDGAFHHVALVKSDGELTLYIDGAPEMTVTDVVSDTTTNNGEMALGYRPTSSDYHFSGVIDELVVYGDAMPGIEVYSLAQRDVASGSNQVDIAFELIDFATYPDVLTIEERQADVTWQVATLDQPAGLGSAWAYTMSDMEDFYYVHVRAEDSNGNQSEAETAWHGLIDHKAPRITASAEQVGWGPLIETVYTFTIVDKVLDESTAVYPCADPDLTKLVYDNSDLPHDGLPYQISGTCTVEDAWQASGTIEMCDAVGHCRQENVVPTAATDLGAIRIVTPTAVLSRTTSGAQIEIAGAAVADSGVQTVNISVDGSLVETISVGGAVTETAWSTLNWAPAVTGTYLIEAEVIDAVGRVYSDVLTINLSDVLSTDALVVTDLTVSGSDLTFEWSATAALADCDVYVYRSTADPYSAFGQWTELTSSPQTVTAPTDETAFYYLSSENCGAAAESDVVGVFQFSLEPGD